MSQRAIHATVHGRVQGVWFRETTRRRAAELGLGGWVRNEPDGSVRVHAEGPPEAIAAFTAFLHEGPPSARVHGVEIEPAAAEGHVGFVISR